MNDDAPYIYKTTDFGKTWSRIDAGLPPTEFVRVVREDPVRRGLLFAGTERGVWVSFDDGAHWQTIRRNLPIVPVHDLVVKEGDLVAATHGPFAGWRWSRSSGSFGSGHRILKTSVGRKMESEKGFRP